MCIYTYIEIHMFGADLQTMASSPARRGREGREGAQKYVPPRLFCGCLGEGGLITTIISAMIVITVSTSIIMIIVCILDHYYLLSLLLLSLISLLLSLSSVLLLLFEDALPPRLFCVCLGQRWLLQERVRSVFIISNRKISN